MPASWHLAPSLVQLRAEINTRWPNRDKTSDGSIGDAAHSARSSDHNPNDRGSVNALDIDEDGPDMAFLLKRFTSDPRVNYVIYERTIYSRSRGFKPRAYSGINAHTKHMHVSILQTVKAEQDTSPWGIVVPDQPTKATPTTPQEEDMALDDKDVERIVQAFRNTKITANSVHDTLINHIAKNLTYDKAQSDALAVIRKQLSDLTATVTELGKKVSDK